MTQLSPEQQEQVVNSFDVGQNQPVRNQPSQLPSQKWHQRHAGKIKTGALLGVMAVLVYIVSGFLLNLRIINADSIAHGANAGDIIGTIYTDEAQTVPIGANKTVALSINGAAKTTVETNDSGQFTFTGSSLNSGDVVAIFLDDETEKASFVFLAQGATYMDGVLLVTGSAKVGHFNGGPITNANLDIADNVGDSDLGISVSGSSANFANGGMKLWVRSDKTYKPGGEVIAGNVRVSGTLDMEANALNATGDLSVSGSVSGSGSISVMGGDASGDGTINMTAGLFKLVGTGNFGGASDWSFNDLTFGSLGSDDTTTKSGAGKISIAGVLKINSTDTLNAGSSTWELSRTGSGTFVVDGTFTPNTSTFEYNGGTSTVYIKDTTYYNLTVNHAGTDFQQPNTTYVNHIFTITAGTYYAGNNIWLYGSGTPFINNGTFSSISGGIIYAGSGNTNVTGGTYSYLWFGGDSDDLTQNSTYSLTGDVTIVTQSVIGNNDSNYTATLAAGDHTITIQNTGTNIFGTGAKGAFDPGTSTVRYTNAGGASELGVVNYYNLEFTPSADATYVFPTDANISNSFTNGTGSNSVSSAFYGSPTIGNFINPANSTFSANDAAISFAGSLANSGTMNLTGTTTVAFTATSSGKTIDVGGTVMPALTFDGEGGEWTLESNFRASSMHFVKGKFIDNGKTVTLDGDLIAEDVPNLIASTGSWFLAANGKIKNYVADPDYASNIFNSLTIKSGVTTTVESYLNVKKFEIENLATINGSRLHIFPKDNNFYVQGESANVSLSNLHFFKNLGEQNRIYETGAINAPSTTLGLQYGTGVTHKMMANWTVLNLIVEGGGPDKSSDKATTLDTNGFNLTIKRNLAYGETRIGVSDGFHAKILFRNGTHRISGNFVPNIIANTSTQGYFDFGSSTVYIGGNLTFRMATSVGTNTGTIIMNGSAAQTFTNTSSVRLNNLKIENSSAAGVAFNDGLYLNGTFTDTTPSSKLTFKSGAIYNFPNININGGSANTKISMLSSSSGARWYFTVANATPTVSYASVRDSSAVAGNQINARTGCTNLGGNVNWDFGEPVITVTPTPSPSPVPSPNPSVEPSVEASAEVSPRIQVSPSAVASSTATLSATPSAASTASANISPVLTATISDIGNDLLTDPVVTSGNAIVLVASGKAVIVGENDEIKVYDSTPEFKGVTQPQAFVEAEITGKVNLTKTTSADEVGTWFVDVKEKLPTGKYTLNLTFKKNQEILGSKSYRFEISKNYWLDALYIGLLTAILVALIVLIKNSKLNKKSGREPINSKN